MTPLKENKTTQKKKKAVRKTTSSARTTAKTSTTVKARTAAKASPVSAPHVSMPRWKRNLWAILILVVFSFGFYQWFIAPYAYRWKPCYGFKGYGVCLPCKYDLHGIDISHYQGTINWHQLKEFGEPRFPIEFVFMKATEGQDFVDRCFQQNFDSVKQAGLVRGAYHFLTPKTDPLKQADFFIRTVKLEKGDLPPVLDVEIKGRRSTSELQRDVKLWLDRVEAHYGVKPIIYASYKFKKRYLSDPAFRDYPYWIAHYYVDSVRYQGPWKFWQHNDVGKVVGIQHPVDLNVFNGSWQQFDSLRIH